VELTVRGSGAVEAWATDLSYGLPDPKLSRARDVSQTVPVQDGDVTITVRKL
jgi:hypothetical protein